MSATRVQQGNLFWPLLFALVLHPLIHQIRGIYKILLHAWYLDDETIVGDSGGMARAINIIQEFGSRLGFELNIWTTKIFWPSCDGNKQRECCLL